MTSDAEVASPPGGPDFPFSRKN